jgi:RNA polymerase sigma-70 factor (ECF subfamily)
MQEAWKTAASLAMDRYACGDDAAFPELYDLLAPRLVAFLSRRVRDHAAAADLLQQTFLQIHCARRHFTAHADVTPWAFAIARRLLVDTYRKRGRELLDDYDGEREDRESASPAPLPDQTAARRRLARRIEAELAAMPEKHRVAFDLVQRDGLSMAEAAEVLGTTVSTVKLRAFRSYEALRAKLGDDVREELDVRS